MSSWLLKTQTIKRATMLKSLKKEMDEIPETNKSQRGILQDQLLVKGICSLTQLDYFRHKSQLKTADLNTSWTFATPVRTISEMIMMLISDEQLR